MKDGLPDYIIIFDDRARRLSNSRSILPRLQLMFIIWAVAMFLMIVGMFVYARVFQVI